LIQPLKNQWIVITILFLFINSAYSVEFPIRVSHNGRYFVDRQNSPFFLMADTPWSLFVALDTAEVRQYFVNRKSMGFNTVTANLIEHWFNGETLAYPEASRNKAGDYPFSGKLNEGIDFTTPNEAYFKHVDLVLSIARQYGFLVLMTPAYMGYAAEGLQEGWYKEVCANGATRCFEYGRFLGRRYSGVPNIAWVTDGDRNPDNISRPLVAEIVRGIREFDKDHLFTSHSHPTNSSRDQWEGASWLDFNCVYTYDFIPGNTTVPEQCLRSYKMNPVMPTFLFETNYENEHNATALKIRAQLYWGWLCSIAGVQFGNLPVWRFGEGWQKALNWQGSGDAAIMKRLVDARKWFDLIPDYDHKAVYEGIGSKDAYVAAAVTSNGETLIAYIPSGSSIGVDLGQITGERVIAWWVNPRNGLSLKAGEFTQKLRMQFDPPDDKDWVLIVDDAAESFGQPLIQ
jgi:hypothetical protein